MSPKKKLADLGLLCWATIHLGLIKGWLSREDVADYAIDLLVHGNDDEDTAIIAGAELLEDNELLELISKKVAQVDNDTVFDKWRLAHLVDIAESDKDEQSKVDNLQEVYANFGYPEDMISCSIYSQDEVDPLVAMMNVIEKLRGRLT